MVMDEDPYAKLWRPITDPAVVAKAFARYPGDLVHRWRLGA